MTDFSELNHYFQEFEEKETFSGVVLITQGESQVYAGSYGYASRTWRIKNSLEMRFDTASITKLFTAVAVLQLIDQTLLSFDTRVIDFLGLENTAISRDVNIYHLLTHTSGIGDDADEESGESYEDLWRTKPNYSVTQTVDFLPQFVHKPANFLPGQGCLYCNCGYVLLGLLVERVSGKEYREYVRKNIFVKAGMLHSDFLHQAQVHENVAEGSDPIKNKSGNIIGWKKNIYSFPPIGSPDSGAYVTAHDLDRFLRAVKRGELLSPRLTEAFFTPQVYYRAMEGWDKKYGYGLWFYIDKAGQVVCYQKEGVNAGVSGAIRYFPKDDISVVILSNMEGGVWKPIWKVHEMMMTS